MGVIGLPGRADTAVAAGSIDVDGSARGMNALAFVTHGHTW